MESRPIEPAALGLAPEWLHLSHLDLSNRISDIPAKCQSSIHAFPVRVQVGRLSDVVPASEVRTHNLSHELSFFIAQSSFLDCSHLRKVGEWDAGILNCESLLNFCRSQDKSYDPYQSCFFAEDYLGISSQPVCGIEGFLSTIH
ncbi:UNVERIFIED_CONTAM: hypothetical protein FKN15_006512 [Acipenser sinensis]